MSEEQKNGNDGDANDPNLPSAPEASNGDPDQDVNTALSNMQKELLYLRADMENSKKRMAREQEQAIKFAHERVFRDLIHIVDLFDRGLDSSKLKERLKGDAEATNFITGMELTHRELMSLMTRFGAEFIGQAGERFDPNRHEAISEEPTPEAAKDGTVTRVLQRGCLLHGRLLSPARVVVAKLTQ